MDRAAMDPAIARVLLVYRESVAKATQRAILDLVAAGVVIEDALEVADMGRRRLLRLRRTTMP